jgi:hypothetical protein
MLKIKGKYKKEDKGFWFFVDYSDREYNIGEIFYHNHSKFTLIKIKDQFDNNLEFIPNGWKTICFFEFENFDEDILEYVEEWVNNEKEFYIQKII